jgi:adenosylcobinamide-phosphate synthase
LLVDAIFGDEPLTPHPVALFGSLMERAESLMYADSRLAGVPYAVAGAGAALAAGALLRRSRFGSVSGAYVTIAGRGLWDAAESVADALRNEDLDAARRLLPALVGRDPEHLDEAEIVRAVVESVAENTVDAIVAPALYGALAGPAGAAGYRGINTLDSLVGHRSPRYRNFGWASARLDDVANLVPARLTALLTAAVRPSSARGIWRAVRRDAPQHPSPNAGVAEAAFAAALGVRLGGVNHYEGRRDNRPVLGSPDDRYPEVDDIDRAVRCSQQVTVALGICLLLYAGAPRHREER